MRVGLLGELEVLDDDHQPVVVSGAKLRSLLALLALSVRRVVPTEQLVDALWGEDPPAGVRNSLQGLVSKLRRTLASTEIVAMRGGGYALDLPADAVDVNRFEQLVAAGRDAAANGDPGRAANLWAEADSLWRGDALADFAYEDFAAATVARLTELRLTTLEERLDLELRLGGHQAATVQLEALVADHPLRERLRGLLMLALYRSGRQADALRVFQEGRLQLGEELGLEPGHELRELEAAILAQDRSLDAPAATPRSSQRDAYRSTIPGSLTELIGRQHEVGDLTKLLADTRLVTLVGPGGVGKTRLAMEAARIEGDRLSSGACLVELAPVGDPSGVRAAVASALDLPDPGRLAELIDQREVLIVLDNCEHVISTAAEVAEDLLRRCPSLRVLATSREGLRIDGETIWPVPPLAPDDAVRLFAARARAAGSAHDLSTDDHDLIGEICSRLDGLPLAIELAAARTRAFPLKQIASRLNDRFRLLTGGSRTALPRQQTLRAVVDWSYELLFEDEQRVFERLSVFADGCDLATAEVVCADDDLAADGLQDLIHALVEKSLVVAVPAGDSLRFTQLQTLVQYGREKLAERGEAARVRDAMAGHFARLCSESTTAYIGDRQRAWLAAMDQERENLRAALEWAVAKGDAETALTIAGGASWPHWLSATVVEGRRWLDDAFACPGQASDAIRALALTGRGLLEFLDGSPERADADLEEALTLFGSLGDSSGTALAYSFYAEIAAVRGDLDEARRRRLDVLAFYSEDPDDPFDAAAREWSLGKLAILDGDLPEAERHHRAAAAGFAKMDRPVMHSIALGIVADFDERAGDHAAAIAALEAAIATNESLGLRGFVGALHARLGWSLLHQGHVDRAEIAHARALDGARRLHNQPVLLQALAGMAVVERARGREQDARAAATEALELYLAGGPRRFKNRVDLQADVLTAAASCCTVLAALAAQSGAAEHAARLLGHAERLRSDANADVPPFQQADVDAACVATRAQLGHDGLIAALEAGRKGDLAADLSAIT